MLSKIDEGILHAVNQGLSNPCLNVIMVILTVIGRPFCLILMSVFFWFRRRRKEALYFAVMIAMTNLLVLGFKFAVGRPRPTDVILVLPQSRFPSFPSGHAACTFASATFLYLCLRERRWFSNRKLLSDPAHDSIFGGGINSDAKSSNIHSSNRSFASGRLAQLIYYLSLFLAFTLAFSIAFSRVYLGKHYPSDVVAGILIGTFIGSFSFRLRTKDFRWLLCSDRTPAPDA